MKPNQEQISDSKQLTKKIVELLMKADAEPNISLVSLATTLCMTAHAVGVSLERLKQGIDTAWEHLEKHEKGTIQ